MNTITFDTFRFISRLKNSGIPENQAEAISEAIKETHFTQLEDLAAKRDLHELEEYLSTKADVTSVEIHVLELKRDIKELDVKLTRDIKELDFKLTRDIKELDVKIETTKVELQRDIKALDVKIEATKVELQRDIKALDVKIEASKTELKRDIKELEYRMTIRLGLMIITTAGMLFTALRYFPPTQPIIISSQHMPIQEPNIGKTPEIIQPTPTHPTP
ncbi:MAG: CCDC90 family protein [Magnetococcus sp. DMHC-6]